MSQDPASNLLAYDPDALARRLAEEPGSVLFLGPPGIGKSTLCRELGERLAAGGACWCLSVDPGSPRFGPPGALSLGCWRDGGWQLRASEALCTLDAGRFRLPLTLALERLLTGAPPAPLLVDAPGLVRGAAGAELLQALVQALKPSCLLALIREPGRLPLAQELAAAALPLLAVRAAEQARRPGKGRRSRDRTRAWEAWLAQARDQRLELAGLALTGTPPPLDQPEAWRGRQLALLGPDQATLALGEVLALEPGALRLRIAASPIAPRALLVRDAQRGADGRLGSAPAPGAGSLTFVPPPDILPYPQPGDNAGPRPLVRVGPALALLVNGVFGDPLLHLRLRQERRSLLFDLGDGARLPARVAHQVSDVFISHAHMDHIAGFLWLLRARIGEAGVCRLFGPPGLAGHLAGLVSGIRWDRIGAAGPRFEVAELHGQRLRRFALRAGGPGPEPLPAAVAPGGLLLDEPGFRVWASELDHGIPVLAFAWQAGLQVRVLPERLAAAGLLPGPWLRRLKQAITSGETDLEIGLPDASRRPAAALAAELLAVSPGPRLVYATDLADSPENRRRLIALARGAHSLFCEAAFAQADAGQAHRTGHLTARACGEIAQAAGVGQLLAFHLSRRYQEEPERIYAEIREVCTRLASPPSG
jgi:ribonuclease BN (tRNA processing enzyme)